jgi:hypothetical protein
MVAASIYIPFDAVFLLLEGYKHLPLTRLQKNRSMGTIQ